MDTASRQNAMEMVIHGINVFVGQPVGVFRASIAIVMTMQPLRLSFSLFIYRDEQTYKLDVLALSVTSACFEMFR